MSNYFFPFPKVQHDSNASSFSPNASKIISKCQNNYPTNRYPSTKYTKSPSAEVLYSIYNSYQKTATPQYLNNLASPNGTGKVSTVSSPVGPKNIFIIRHAEKNSPSQYYLNLNGIYRACNLVDYINSLAIQGYPISYIVTCNPAPLNDSPSMRPQQTVAAASFLLNIPTFIFSSEYDPDGITATRLFLSNATDESSIYNNVFNGLNVLIAWEHTNIQQLYLNIAAAAYNNNRITLANTCYNSIYNLFENNNGIINGSFNYIASNYSNNIQSTLGVPYYAISNNMNIGNDPSNNIYKLTPYWNINCYDLQINFLSNLNGKYEFSVSQQPISTCYYSCNLQIGMFQIPLPVINPGSVGYIDGNTGETLEEKCQLPIT